MKKIINGKKYDTDTAMEICHSVSGDFGCKRCTLYRKENGEYFEHHELRDFEHRKWIVPVSESEAKVFAEEFLGADRYEEMFGKVSE